MFQMDGQLKTGLDHYFCEYLLYNQLAIGKQALAHNLKRKTKRIVGGESCLIKKLRHCSVG